MGFFVFDFLSPNVGPTNLEREIGVDNVSDSDGAGAGETTDNSRCGRKWAKLEGCVFILKPMNENLILKV